ncbi:uncharacterized protein [Dysidea avara]
MTNQKLLICGLLLCFSCMLFYYVSDSYTIKNFGLVYKYNETMLPVPAVPKSTHINVANNVNSSKDAIVHNSESRGFVLCVSVIEQQVGAAMNILTLSKWAKHVGILPVEPFVKNSLIRWPSNWSQSEISTELRFRDYFNLDYWNSMCPQFNAAPLVPFETFLSRKTNLTIIVFVGVIGHCSPQDVFVDDEINSNPCRNRFRNFEKQHDYNINQVLQTKIVRRVCIPMCRRQFHIDTISNYIYGSFKPEETTVLVTQWFGIDDKNRLGIVEPEYWRTTKTVEMLHRSNRVKKDSRKYVKKYLDSDFGEYVAISFRSVKRAKKLGKSRQSDFFKECIKELGSTVNSLKYKKVFLAMDIGRFGDKAHTFIAEDVEKMIEHDLFHIVLNDTLTMEQYEQSFINATNGITDSGYIAALQSNILENSGCLVMFGGSSYFQESLLYEYKQKHTNESMCIKEVCYISVPS